MQLFGASEIASRRSQNPVGAFRPSYGTVTENLKLNLYNLKTLIWLLRDQGGSDEDDPDR